MNNAMITATQQAHELTAAHNDYSVNARLFARGRIDEAPVQPAHEVNGEEGRVSWRITMGGNSRRMHARITFKIDGKRASREEVAKLA